MRTYSNAILCIAFIKQMNVNIIWPSKITLWTAMRLVWEKLRYHDEWWWREAVSKCIKMKNDFIFGGLLIISTWQASFHLCLVMQEFSFHLNSHFLSIFYLLYCPWSADFTKIVSRPASSISAAAVNVCQARGGFKYKSLTLNQIKRSNIVV